MGDFDAATPVDVDHLEVMTDGDKEFAAELIEMYRVDTRQRLDTLDEALNGSDLDRVEREAHTIKGASSNVGTNLVREVAFELEALARQGDLSRGIELLDRLRQEFDRAEQFFSSYLAD